MACSPRCSGESSAKDARPNGLGFGNVPESTLHMKRLSTQMLRCALAIRVQSREYFTERQNRTANRIAESNRKQAAFSERVPGRCVRSASVVEGGSCFTWELRSDGTCLCGGYFFQQELLTVLNLYWSCPELVQLSTQPYSSEALV